MEFLFYRGFDFVKSIDMCAHSRGLFGQLNSTQCYDNELSCTFPQSCDIIFTLGLNSHGLFFHSSMEMLSLLFVLTIFSTFS